MHVHPAYGLAKSGDRDRAIAIRRQLETEGRERYTSHYHLALISAGLGDRAAVFNWLERPYNGRSSLGLDCVPAGGAGIQRRAAGAGDPASARTRKSLA